MALEGYGVPVDADSVCSYLTGRVSSSIVYLLSLQQPLTLREMRSHPLRLMYLRTRGGKGARAGDLKSVVRRGVREGILVALTTRREYYYFLNSDLFVRAPTLGAESAGPEVDMDTRAATAQEDICVPPGSSLARDHPIPLLRDPAEWLAWLDWLTTPRKRSLLQAVVERGPLTRAQIAREGVRLDLGTIQAGVRSGVLRLKDGKVDFQFSRVRIPPENVLWTSRPPKVWPTRTYEPLRCVQGSETYLQRPGDMSPMKLLMEMAEDGRRVIPSRRKEFLRVNFVYEPSALVPRIEEVGPGSIPTMWENRRHVVCHAEGAYERAMSTIYLEEELRSLPRDRELDWRTPVLRRMAKLKLEAYFKRREEELMRRFKEHETSGYGLGPGAIMSLASAELERDRLQEERKHFERFLEVLGL